MYDRNGLRNPLYICAKMADVDAKMLIYYPFSDAVYLDFCIIFDVIIPELRIVAAKHSPD